jgi:AraC-like DNA-binding protein
MDVLSDVLRVVRLSGAVFFTADFSSPWAIESPIPGMLASAVMPEAECVVLFHILVDGECEVDCQGHPRTGMESGDVVVFPRGDQHTMRSHGARQTTPLASIFSPGEHDELGRLTELMFVEILREYMQRLPANQSGWFAAVNDPHVGKALRLLHANPVRDWTVDELSREVGLSRSVLAQRFVDLVGEAPIRYLANWRMQLAKQMMREGTHNIQQVATRVGYDSEAAFNRAFKRATGAPPATWRKGATPVS